VAPGTAPSACSLESVEPGRYALAGDLGIESAPAILARGESEFRGQARVEVDLSGVTDADSAGLAVLIEWTRGARLAGRDLVFHSVPARLAAIAHIGGVRELLPIAG
jgi:phospholipid transport system transporter-binding protein